MQNCRVCLAHPLLPLVGPAQCTSVQDKRPRKNAGWSEIADSLGTLGPAPQSSNGIDESPLWAGRAEGGIVWVCNSL
ncbi:hypothetical protein BDV23DRAFT_9994 [Aspergillus alliaceus]|uniref:Uncharacterized protein n=1 Tax=Petromyces alliaceus TaxID=209559 RepID=A0A5N7BVY8_PETAA|nr:hypothetical protein BDV23DRAFT_9994 [Aspergillus alliaceus]